MVLDPGVTDTRPGYMTEIRIRLLFFIYKKLPVIWGLPGDQYASMIKFLALEEAENPPALTCKMIGFFVAVMPSPPVSHGTEREGTGTFPL